MWRWAFDLSKTRRARKAAGAAISPMVDKSRRRLGGIPDAAWSDPYVVGFTMMLITIVSRMEIGKLEGQALCYVQAKAWEDITEQSNTIGEDLILLSAARNRDFEIGCRNAVTFAAMLVGRSIPLTVSQDRNPQHPDLQDTATFQVWAERADMSVAWEHFFDAHISIHSAHNTFEGDRPAL